MSHEFPTVAFPHYRLALTMADEGDLAAAERGFRRAAQLRPKWVEPHVALARLYARHGLHEPARAAAARALELAPGDARKEELEKIVRSGDGG